MIKDMPQELFDKWINALESDEYEQGHSQLRFKSQYCCLGVLADQIDPNGWDGIVWMFDGTRHLASLSLFGDVDPSFYMSMEEMSTLVSLNDGTTSEDNIQEVKHSFTEIADWLKMRRGK